MAKIYTSTNISQECKKKQLLQANNQSRELQIYQLKITKKMPASNRNLSATYVNLRHRETNIRNSAMNSQHELPNQ